MIITVFETFFANLWTIMFILLVAFKGKTLIHTLFLEPIRGGNGKTQMDELAKYMMIFFLGVVVFAEIRDDKTVVDPTVFLYLVLGVALIAGVDVGKMWMKNKNGGEGNV